MIFSENRLPSPDQVRGQAFSGSCSVQQRAVRRHLVELVDGRGNIGGVLVDGVEGKLLMKFGGYRSGRRPGDLNIVVGDFVRSATGVRRGIAAEILMEGETVITRATERRRCKRQRCSGRRRRGG